MSIWLVDAVHGLAEVHRASLLFGAVAILGPIGPCSVVRDVLEEGA